MGLLLEGIDARTRAKVLIKSTLYYDVVPYAKVRDTEGFTNQLRLPRKTLEMERRILVLLRNAGCNAVPHPNDFVFDANPSLAGPFTTDDRQAWEYGDAAMIESEPYLIMEFVRGQSLATMLKSTHRFPEKRALRVITQIAEVFRTLHEPKNMRPGMTWQIIYQDLKPSNLLLSSQDRVTVIDLGGSQLVNLDSGQKLLPGAATAGYCPPECESPYNVLTPAADVYTLGTLLFHLLTGRNPQEFLGSKGLLLSPRAAALDLGLLPEATSSELRRILERCLRPDPSDRYPDIGSFQQDLHPLLVGISR